MKIAGIRTITGPNVYSHKPVILMKLDLEDLTEVESYEVEGFTGRLVALLPGLREHVCAKGEPGGFIERLEEGTYFGHIIEHVALELTELAGVAVYHGKTRLAGRPGLYHVIVEYKAEEATRYLLRVAVELVEALRKGQPFSLENPIEEARRTAAKSEYGPSTRAILEAAARRNIPYFGLGGGSLVQLGYGKHRQLIQAAMSGRTSAIAVDIACDKELTKRLLREASIPVPYGVVVESEAEALEVMRDMNVPLAVKPYDGCQGKGVSLNLSSAAQVQNAFRLAQQYSRQVLIEEMLRGRDYRVLVVGGRMVAASERLPAHVVGDGRKTIAELIELVNQDPLRGDGHENSLTRIVVDEALKETLSKYDLRLHCVPLAGQTIYLRECANLSTGGTAKDMTDRVHPDVAAVCERAARVIGLDICGIDLIADDITQPLGTGDGVVEINAAPGLRMHVAPSEGQRREVGDAIVEMLYPESRPSRIPIISITGTNGKTTITRMIARAIADSGKAVGMTTTDGIFLYDRLNDRRLAEGDTTGPVSARMILSDPAVEVAVLETARGGLVRSGLAYDWSDISIISNIRADHLGQDGIETLDDLLHIKSLLAERVREGGTLILNADDERLATLADSPRVNRVKTSLVYFSMHPHHVLIKRHLDAGGTAYVLNRGWVVEAQGNSRSRLLRAADIPITLGGAADFQIANTLAAVAACRAYGLSREEIAETLTRFNSCEHNSGRANLYRVAGGYVLVDYGHNPDAFAAVCKMASRWVGRRVTGVIAVPGDRNNTVAEEAAAAAARGFQRLIIKEDRDLRGRQQGEVAELLCRTARQVKEGLDCRIVLEEADAVREAVSTIEPEEIIVVFYEKLATVLSVLGEFGAAPAGAMPPLAYPSPMSMTAEAGRAKFGA